MIRRYHQWCEAHALAVTMPRAEVAPLLRLGRRGELGFGEKVDGSHRGGADGGSFSKEGVCLLRDPERPRTYLTMPLGVERGSFSVAFTVVIRALFWDGKVWIGLHRGEPPLPPAGRESESGASPATGAASRVDPDGHWFDGTNWAFLPGQIGAFGFKAQIGSRARVFAPEEFREFPDRAGTYSTGTEKSVEFLCNAAGKPLQSRVPYFYEYGKAYRCRITYWAPREELGLAVWEEESALVLVRRWRLKRERVEGKKFLLCAFSRQPHRPVQSPLLTYVLLRRLGVFGE